MNDDDECPDVFISDYNRSVNCYDLDHNGCWDCPRIYQDTATTIDYRYRSLIPLDPSDIARMEAAGERIRILISTKPHFINEIRHIFESSKETIVFSLVDHQNRVVVQEKKPIVKLLRGEEIVLSFILKSVRSSSKLIKYKAQPRYFLKIHRTGGITDTKKIKRRSIKLQIKMKVEKE